MTTPDTANISFDANIHLEDRDDRWATRRTGPRTRRITA